MKILTNPYLILGALVGGAWLIKNKPTTKTARVATSLKKGATSLITEAGEFATDIVDTGVSTGQDIFSVFEAGDAEGDIEFAGFDGARGGISVDNADTEVYVNGDGNTGTCGVDIEDTDNIVAPDDEGSNSAGFDGGGRMNFNDYDY